MHRVINYLMLFVFGFAITFFIIYGSLMAFKSNLQANTLADATQSALYKSHDNTERLNRGEYITNFPKFVYTLNRFNIATYNYQDLHFVSESPSEMFNPSPAAAIDPPAKKNAYGGPYGDDSGKPLSDFGDGAYRVQYLLDDSPRRRSGAHSSTKNDGDEGYATYPDLGNNSVKDYYDKPFLNGKAVNPIASTHWVNGIDNAIQSDSPNDSRHYAIRAVRVIAYMKPTGYHGEETKFRNQPNGDTGRKAYGMVKGAPLSDDYHVVTYAINTFGKNIAYDAHSNPYAHRSNDSKAKAHYEKISDNSPATDTDLTRNHLDNSNLAYQENGKWTNNDAFGKFVYGVVMHTLGHIIKY